MESGDEPAVKAALQILAHSKRDPDLAGIRDEAGLAKLPEDERETWRVFWADLEAVLAGASMLKIEKTDKTEKK